MIVARKIFLLLFALSPISSGKAGDIIPTTKGMAWKYNLIEEAGEGFRLSDPQSDSAGKVRTTVVYRINGTRELDGKKLLEFEMHRAGRITNTDLMAVDELGLACWARVNEKGELIKLGAPQTMVASPLQAGSAWVFNADVAQTKVEQAYRVAGEEEIVVPAGKFKAFHIHGQQSAPGPMIIDRWFVPGVGIVKDVTETRSDAGEMLRRISLELTEPPKIAPRPEIKPLDQAKKLSALVSTAPVGDATGKFTSATPKIYARWHGQGLRPGAVVRCVWIAERVDEIAPPDYIVDESTTTATAPDSYGLFALMRPKDGWKSGDYRVEFSVDDEIIERVKLKIEK